MSRIHQKTLLLVEDEVLLAMNEQISLEERGYAVKVAGSGEQALEAVAGPGRIDLVLMDIDLGKGLDGTEVAARILERRDLPIVFLSSHTETEFVEKTESISSYGYVVKDSGITVLDASIKMAFKLHEANGRIRESEEKYRHLHENADIGIGYYSPEGTVISYNAIAARTMGGAPGDFIGKSIFQLFPEREARFYLDRIEAACGSDEAASYEDLVRLPAGDRWFLSIFTKVTDTDGEVLGIQIISKDLGSSKAAALSLGRDEAESLNRYIDDSPMATVEWNSEFVVTRWAGEARAMFGWTAEEVIGKRLEDLGIVYPDDYPIVGRTLARLADSSSRNVVSLNRNVTKDGAIINCEWYNSSIFDSDGKLVSALSQVLDVTERVASEERLRHSEAKYRSYVDNASDGIFVVDEAGRFIDANLAACRLSGYGREELLSMSIPEISVYEPGEAELSLLTGVLAAGSVKIERRYRHKDGSIRWWSVDAIAMGDRRVMAMARDVSERKAIERTLRESEERLSFVLKGSELGYWDWDLATSAVKRDERWAQMLGYSLGELEATTDQWAALCHPDDYEFIWKSITDHLEGRNDFYDIEYRMRTKDGRYRWIHDSGKIVRRDAAGRPLRACGTHRDITDEKEKERRIAQLLEEKELILKEVHHRVKNNMNTMRSLVSLQRQSLSDAGALAALLDVENRFNSMLVLYERLNQSSSYVDVSAKPYLTTLIEEIVGNFPNSASVKVNADIEDVVLGAKLAQTLGIIVNELLTNIMKYAFVDIEDAAISVEGRLEGKSLRLRVGDNGVGMPEGIDFRQSSGFGLMLIGQLTRQVGGAIRIERGEGTRVLLEVPT